MKVVYLADAPYPHTWRWVQHFARLGHQCEVISFRPAEIEGATVHYVDGAERLGKARYLIHARRVGRLIESLQPDLLHALHLTSYGFLGALSGVHPFLLSVWGTDILEAPALSPFHHWLTRHALAHADQITATGLHLATETTLYAPEGAGVTVVPYGVDLDQFAPAKRKPPHDGLIIGATARLSPEKGLSHLIDAFALLRTRSGDGIRLRIAGEGPDRPRLEAQVQRLGLGDAVELLGWLDHDDVPAYLQTLDVFVLPSTWEGFGVVACEASAVELPIVATNVYGIPDAVRDGVTGLLVPPADPAALADAIARLLDDAGPRARLGKAGRAFVAENYDWRQNTQQMERIYEDLVSGRAGALAK